MKETFSRKECLERYCPVVRKNVLMDVTQSGAERQIKICCHRLDECKSCYGKCKNIYAVPAAEAAMKAAVCTQRRSW